MAHDIDHIPLVFEGDEPKYLSVGGAKVTGVLSESEVRGLGVGDYAWSVYRQGGITPIALERIRITDVGERMYYVGTYTSGFFLVKDASLLRVEFGRSLESALDE